MTITDIEPSHNSLRNAYVHFPELLGMCYGTDMLKAYKFFHAPNSHSEKTKLLSTKDGTK